MQKVLISGAGIAGLTAACWLDKFGYAVELIDRVNDLEAREGYAIDFWGPGVAVAKAMDITSDLAKINLDYKKIKFCDRRAKVGSQLYVEQMRAFYPEGFFTLLRGGLEKILLSRLGSHIKIALGKTLTKIENTAAKVKVEFHDGSTGEYDYLIGADGVHSQVRKLLWGDEGRFSVDLGYEVCAFMATASHDLGDTVSMFNAPKRSITLMPINPQRIAAYAIYRNDVESSIKEPLARMRAAFKDFPPAVDELLTNLHADNLFHDTVAQIEVKPWQKDRVILLGDACQCLTLVAGQGASMAMASAYTMAVAIKNNNIEHYVKLMQPIIAGKQKAARGFCKSFVPSSKLGLFFRDIAVGLIRFPWLARLFLGKMLREDWTMQDADDV